MKGIMELELLKTEAQLLGTVAFMDGKSNSVSESGKLMDISRHLGFEARLSVYVEFRNAWTAANNEAEDKKSEIAARQLQLKNEQYDLGVYKGSEALMKFATTFSNSWVRDCFDDGRMQATWMFELNRNQRSAWTLMSYIGTLCKRDQSKAFAYIHNLVNGPT